MKRKAIAALLTGTMILSAMALPISAAEENATASDASALAQAFASPDQSYQPGVRWWWPGGAVEKDQLAAEIDYLAEFGFAYVEINPFYVSTVLAGDEERVTSIYTPEFYELLDYAIGLCEEKGITVDLNMGSGWNANSSDVTYSESMGNMALGRSTVTVSDLISSTEIPTAERSLFYTGEGAKGEWQDDSVVLQGVLVGELTGESGTDFVPGEGMFGPKPSYEEVYDSEGNVLKSYDTQVVLNPANSLFLEADDAQIQDGKVVLSEDTLSKLSAEKSYEVVAMYYVPSGGKAIDAAPAEWYTVDHMDAAKVADYMNDWLGNENLSAILKSHKNIRALFNDSYEFYSDIYYTESLEELAADAENNGLGYDFRKYLPTIYKQYSAAPYYMGLGTTDTYLTYTLNDDEKSRIQYDYNLLVNQKFQEGMEAFQEGSAANGLQYRQEAYNPPIDTIGSAAYIDIPESEQADELSLIRTTSGAHLYGKNLTTAEQYTLGCTPLTNTLEQVKVGYDIMATSGVNNFFYHGLMYGYGIDTEEYGELGWAPFPSIGINMSNRNTLFTYFDEMNEYAARVNYLMQQGTASKDVAYYMAFNGSLSNTDAIQTMNTNGIAWDAINDDSIVNENTTVVDGKISVNGGNMIFDALVVEADKVPVATMEKLSALAADGANIVFYGSTPSAQPGYCDGAYAEADAKTVEAAESALAGGAVLAATAEEFAEVLAEKTSPEVSYEANENVRFIRRTLEDGSEIAFIRNLSDQVNTITVKASEQFGDCYFLDQNSGKIYAADKAEDGTITLEMAASTDTLGGMGGGGAHSMAIALLCTPEGSSLDASLVTEGTPVVLDQTEASSTVSVNIDTLTVGDKTYTEDVLGKWNSEEFQNGELKNSDETGVYYGSFTLENIGESSAVLKLSEVYIAASVVVNGESAGSLMFNPYELDITSFVQEGENTIEIAVTPRKYNAIHTEIEDIEGLVDTGMAGEAVVEIR